MTNKIPFNKPHVTGKEFDYIQQAINQGVLSGNGEFTKKCQNWLESNLNCQKALLTHSCTAALEMSAILANIQPGDEVIMPSYTFVSTANAFVLRGGIPVFIDIRLDTLNLDETKIEAAITAKTKAIAPVHYAGVSCEMDTIMDIANHHNLIVIEDAAQGILSSYKGKALGTFGNFGALSFHETKNVICGEGGALLINDQNVTQRAEIIWEKGTNRSQFFRGQVDKYTWVDLGSSFLPSEINAAFLYAQLQQAEIITKKRLEIWHKYDQAFKQLESQEKIKLPSIPDNCQHNAHMYYLILPDLETRTKLINHLKSANIYSVFHYIPLHSSPSGLKYGRTDGNLTNTDTFGDRLLRLPLWIDMTEEMINRVITGIYEFFTTYYS